MNQVFLATRNFWCGEDGVTAIEYALIAALIAVAVIATVYFLGQQLDTFFSHLKDCMQHPSTC